MNFLTPQELSLRHFNCANNFVRGGRLTSRRLLECPGLVVMSLLLIGLRFSKKDLFELLATEKK